MRKVLSVLFFILFLGEVFDNLSRLVKTANTGKSLKTRIDVRGLKTGVYYIVLVGDKAIFRQKIIINR